MEQKFELGRTVMTASVDELVQAGQVSMDTITNLVLRHSIGDWGDMVTEDRELNESGLSKDNPGTLHSSFPISGTLKIWVITEWDRSTTTVLLPEDY